MMPVDHRTWIAGLLGLSAVAAYVVLPSLLPSASAQPQKRYTTGLVNTGNDCFANSTFQALAALATLSGFLSSEQDETKPWTSALAQLLADLQQESSTPRRSSIWPALRLIERLYHAHMSRGQQDAHELLLKVIELLEREHAASDVPLPFKGVLRDTIRCQRCGHTTHKDTEFLVLERLPGEEPLKPQSELINDFNCSECGLTVIEKTSRVSQVPRILVVHINRSVYANAGFRNSTAVEIPLHLGLLHELQLRAVVYHRGNHDRGHYTAARRRRIVEKEDRQQPWWVISDDHVRPGTTRQVLGRNTEAYMLFYETDAPGKPAKAPPPRRDDGAQGEKCQ